MRPTGTTAADSTAGPPEPVNPQLASLLAKIEAVAVEDRGQPFLWRVEGKRKKHKGVALLYGSVHLGRPDLYPLPREIDAAYGSADRLAVEMDLSDPEVSERMGAELMSLGRLPDGQSLQTLLPERFEELKQGLGRLNIPVVLVQNMTPFMVAMTYTVAEMMSAGWNPELGIDKHFLDRARADGKEIVELEGLERQLATFRDMEMDTQLAMLEGTLDMAGATHAWTEKAWEALRVGDDRALLTLRYLEESDDDDYAEYERVLLGDRNEEMAAKIAEHVLAGDDVMLVVVGALHLPGEDGLVTLLGANKKLKVSREPGLD